MERYSATRLALRICVSAVLAGPAWGQVQVGDLVVRPAPDGVTVTLAQDESPDQQPGILPAQHDPAPASVPTPAPAPVPSTARPAVTRITLTADELPPAQPAQAQAQAQAQAHSRPLPPLPAPRRHELERDVLTMKAARAAMQLDDQMHDRKMASLR